MISRIIMLIICFGTVNFSLAQNKTYKDSIESYFKKYVKEHEVVTGKDKEFMSFFPVNEKYRMNCRFERTVNSPWFPMST